MLKMLAPLLLAAVAALAAGCGGGGGGATQEYNGARLEGAVSIDGQNIESGSIQFVPADEQAGPIVQAPILQGRYVAPKVPLGKVTAILNIPPPSVPKEVTSDYQPPPMVAVPARYKDGIPIEVKGDNPDQDFALSSRE